MPPTSKTEEPAVEAQALRASPVMAIIAPAVGWFVPGAGHFVQRRWIRGLLLMVSIVAMFLLGLAMQGKVYAANTGDILDMLGFVGDVGNGALYIITVAIGGGQGAIHRATADYGTKYIIVAGLLNIVAAVDAYHIAMGKKP